MKLGRQRPAPLGVFEAIYGDAKQAEEAQTDEEADIRAAAVMGRFGR